MKQSVGYGRSSRALRGLVKQELWKARLATATTPAGSPGGAGVCGAAAGPGRGGG